MEHTIVLPDTFTVSAPKSIGGGKYTFATPDILPVLCDLIRNGLQQKYSDKVASKEGQANFPTASVLGDHFAARFRNGIWNEKAGGGARLDEFEKFCRMQAMRFAKKAFAAEGRKADDADATKAWIDQYLADEANMAKLEAAWELIGD